MRKGPCRGAVLDMRHRRSASGVPGVFWSKMACWGREKCSHACSWSKRLSWGSRCLCSVIKIFSHGSLNWENSEALILLASDLVANYGKRHEMRRERYGKFSKRTLFDHAMKRLPPKPWSNVQEIGSPQCVTSAVLEEKNDLQHGRLQRMSQIPQHTRGTLWRTRGVRVYAGSPVAYARGPVRMKRNKSVRFSFFAILKPDIHRFAFLKHACLGVRFREYGA